MPVPKDVYDFLCDPGEVASIESNLTGCVRR